MLKALAPYLGLALAFALILWRNRRPRKIPLGRMWIGPVLLGCGAAAAIAASPTPRPLVMAGFSVMFLAGAGIGFLRARHMQLAVDPATGHILGKATPLGAAILVALLLARFGYKSFFAPAATPATLDADVLHASDGLLSFSFAMLATQYAVLRQRGRQLLADHSAGAAPAPGFHDR